MTSSIEVFKEWREGLTPYNGVDTKEALVDILDSAYADDPFQLLLGGPAAHLHEIWIFWQFLHAQDTNMLPVFAGRLEYAPYVLHLAKLLRANDLVARLEEGLAMLSDMPEEIIRDYIEGRHANSSPDTKDQYNTLGDIIDTGYDDLVSNSDPKGAVGAPPRGDDLKIFNALASYIEALRDGTIEPDPLPLREDFRAILEVEQAASRVAAKTAVEAKAQRDAEIAPYLAQGHGYRVVSSALTRGSYDPIVPELLEAANKMGISLAVYMEELNYHLRSFRDPKVGHWIVGDPTFISTSDDRTVVAIRFLDASLLIDLATHHEITRIEREPIVQESYDPRSYVRLADKPRINIPDGSNVISFPPWYKFWTKVIKYAR